MSLAENPFRQPSTRARNRPHGNLTALRIAVLLLFAILAAQLFRMQIVDGAEYAEKARENHITQTTNLAARGPITDRNGEPLVQNIGIYVATIIPEFLPDPRYVDDANERRYTIYLALERILGVPALEIQKQVNEAEEDGLGYIAIPIAKYLTKEQALMLEEASVDMPGVSLSIKPGRWYPAGEAFSHILGYVGDQTAEEYAILRERGYALDEVIGKTGVESEYEADLRGVPGVTAAEQDAQGQLLQELASRPAEPGNGVRLAIDAGLQNYIYELLQDYLPGDATHGDAKVAAAVVMNPKTGELYALVSFPSYDNNIFSEPERRASEYLDLLEDPRKPLLNQALTPSAPGSTFKLVTAAAGLQNGTIQPQTSRDIPTAVMEVTGENGVIYPFRDWKPHGTINLYSAIAWSSNIYFYLASCGKPREVRGLGEDPESSAAILAYYARQFGFGRPTGLDIGGEGVGIIPEPAWKRRVHANDNPEDREWYYADTCFMGIGQGDVLATPLQVARMTAAVANGGFLVTPHVAESIVDAEGNVVRTIQPQLERVDVDARHLAVIREGMLQSVVGGAGAKAYVDGIDFAGKTGTAEFYLPDGTPSEHAWFTGFAPFDDPEVVVTVYFDIGVGGEKAAPIAGNILRYFWEEVRGQ